TKRMPKGLEEALAYCLERMERDDATLEEVVREYPELRGELEPLLKLAQGLRALPRVRAPESLRSSRRPVFPSHDTHTGILFPRWRRIQPSAKLATVIWCSALTRLAAGITLVFLLLGGVAVASANSLPDETLYTVKLAIEDLQLATASNPQTQVELEMQFASRRLEEVEAAVRQGRVESAQRGLDLYQERVTKLLDRVEPASEADDGAVLGSLQVGLERQQEVLSRVLHQLPEQAQSSALRAMEVSGKAWVSANKPSNEPKGPGSSKPKKAVEASNPPTATAVPGTHISMPIAESAPGMPPGTPSIDSDRGPQGKAKGHTASENKNENAQNNGRKPEQKEQQLSPGESSSATRGEKNQPSKNEKKEAIASPTPAASTATTASPITATPSPLPDHPKDEETPSEQADRWRGQKDGTPQSTATTTATPQATAAITPQATATATPQATMTTTPQATTTTTPQATATATPQATATATPKPRSESRRGKGNRK
ncbi:MAG: DUF5667 domain-containing protein, partial [Chloroflexota bacterium]